MNARGLVLAGVYASGETGHALANSRGLWASHRERQVELSVTAEHQPPTWTRAQRAYSQKRHLVAPTS